MYHFPLSFFPVHYKTSFPLLQGQEEIVEMLLNYGLEIMVTNLYGETPLHIACRRGNIGLYACPLTDFKNALKSGKGAI